MVLEELREIVDLVVQHHPGGVLGRVLLHLAHRDAGRRARGLAHGLILRRGLFSIRLIFLDIPHISSLFFGFHILLPSPSNVLVKVPGDK